MAMLFLNKDFDFIGYLKVELCTAAKLFMGNKGLGDREWGSDGGAKKWELERKSQKAQC